MNRITKYILLSLAMLISFSATAGELSLKATESIQVEINGLNAPDTRQVLVKSNATLYKLALNNGVGLRSKDEVVERSIGCSNGCSVGCSNGCSIGCSNGCSVGCR